MLTLSQNKIGDSTEAKWSSQNIFYSQDMSETGAVKIWYSTLELERVTIVCFSEHQEIKLVLRKMQYPVVVQQVSGYPAQSAFRGPTKHIAEWK